MSAWRNGIIQSQERFGAAKTYAEQREKFDKFDFVRVGVALAVLKGGKVLLHKRKGVHASGFWAFAGGHLEKWESLVECCNRELKEEVGPDFCVENIRFCTVLNTMYPKEDRHYVTIIMVADYVSGEPIVMEPDKCECWEWHDWDNPPEPLMLGLQMMKRDGIELK